MLLCLHVEAQSLPLFTTFSHGGIHFVPRKSPEDESPINEKSERKPCLYPNVIFLCTYGDLLHNVEDENFLEIPASTIGIVRRVLNDVDREMRQGGRADVATSSPHRHVGLLFTPSDLRIQIRRACNINT